MGGATPRPFFSPRVPGCVTFPSNTLSGTVVADTAFTCDCMLGRLARWLRILGYEADFFRRIEDAKLIRHARAAGRVLLTRDTRLVKRRGIGPHLLIRSNDTFEQLRETISTFSLAVDDRRLFRRCIVCGKPLQSVPKESVRGLVPPYVYKTQAGFSRCPVCKRFYWPATHHRHMLVRLQRFLEGNPGGGSAPKARSSTSWRRS